MPALPKIPPLALVVLLGALMVALDAALPWPFMVPVRMTIATLLAAAGGVLVALSIITFRRRQTTLDPRVPEHSSVLVTHDVFALSRNPIYLGFALWLLALCALLGNPLALAGPVAFVLYMNGVQIPAEERALRERFGESFERYRARTRRWM